MFPSDTDIAAIEARLADYRAADRAALAHLLPGTLVQHTLYPNWRGVVARTFEDEEGWWVERTDGAIARPRFWVPAEPARDVATVKQRMARA